MPAPDESLTDRLSRFREIKITVTGRKSGRAISNPVWFVYDGKLRLLPVYGSDTQWYKNVLQNPKMKVEARGAAEEFKAKPITGAQQVSAVVAQFREKYGAADVKKYYSKFDVAVSLEPVKSK
ncbi:MAG TPA: nitroreductase/quinone reductase family protein [Candidatus Binatia bacterium]|nr:nitroreductase/quinone reductase family protein [Candidatus Binatia bacterium]